MLSFQSTPASLKSAIFGKHGQQGLVAHLFIGRDDLVGTLLTNGIILAGNAPTTDEGLFVGY
jgi:hypothetical protein